MGVWARVGVWVWASAARRAHTDVCRRPTSGHSKEAHSTSTELTELRNVAPENFGGTMAVASEDPIAELKRAGNASLKEGKLDEAVASYTSALSRDPDRQHAEASVLLANRALAHLKLENPVEAKVDCTAALALQPRYGKAYYRRAQAHEAIGALSDAFADVRELMSLEPKNKEAATLAGKLKRAMEKRAASSDLSTPIQAVEALRAAARDSDDAVQAVGKLSRIAEDGSRSLELLHSGAVEALVALLPAPGALTTAREIQMPLIGLVVEALDRIGGGESAQPALKAISRGDTLQRVEAVARLAAGARAELADEAAAAAADAAADKEVEVRRKNLLIVARRGLSLVSTAAGSRSAAGSQDAQGRLVLSVLRFLRHAEESVARAAQDGLVRACNADPDGAKVVLPQILGGLIWLLGDEESDAHRIALGVLARLLAIDPKAEDDDDKKAAQVSALTNACEGVLSPILRSDTTEWDAHVAAVHGVTAVLEVNKEVGAYLLKQESIFWSLAEAAELEDEHLNKSLAEIYAHAANDTQHFRDKAGDEPIRQLKKMLKSAKPRVRCRACVALAKVALLHQNHRVDINPSGKLLTATLGLLEAKVPPSVHRWAVEALMFLTVLPDTKAHMIEKAVGFGSLVALSESVKDGDTSLHFSLVQAFRRLCVARDKSDDQKRLEQEMEPRQIEQMRQMQQSAGGAGAAPSEKEDDPEHLRLMAWRLVQDDAVCVLAEVVASAKSAAISLPAAQVLLSMACTPEARGKIVQQGGFKALLSLTLSEEPKARSAAAWGLAKVGISIDPKLYPRRTGSGPEAMVLPLLTLLDVGENELETFEGCMALCNLATVPELRDRIVSNKGWRALEMAMTSNNEMVQRAALECMSNLVTHEEVAEKFTVADSTAVKIFCGFCGADDVKCQVAASGAIATLAGVPEIATALLANKVLDPLVEIALISEELGCVHRAAVALQRLFGVATDEIVGTKGGTPPEHAMLALGALSVLAGRRDCPPAAAAAVSTIEELAQGRPDVAMPPQQLVAEAVKRMKEDAEAREAEREAEEAAARAEAAARKEAEASEDAALEAKREARRQAQEAEQAMEQAGTPRNIDTRNMTAAEKELVSELGPMIEEGSDEDEVGTVL